MSVQSIQERASDSSPQSNSHPCGQPSLLQCKRARAQLPGFHPLTPTLPPTTHTRPSPHTSRSPASLLTLALAQRRGPEKNVECNGTLET